MKFSFTHFRLPFSLLLIFAGLLICLPDVCQTVFAQNGEQLTPKEVAHPKDPLNLDNIFKALRSDKATMPQKNQLLIQGVKMRGISFVMTDEVKSELTNQGASKMLIEALQSETEELLKSPFYYRERADDFRLMKNYPEAISNYNKTLELDPNDRVAYNNRGHLFQELKQYNEAISDFSKVIELDPTDRNGYNNRGVIYYYQNEFQKAIEDYSQAIAIDPNFKEAYINRANAFQVIGQKQSADADRRQAQSIKR